MHQYLLASFILLIITLVIPAKATILHVGPGHPYGHLEAAVEDVSPGDTIRVHELHWAGGIYIENLQGTPDAWITIEAAEGELVVYGGGSNAWQFTDAAYLVIKGFTFEQQTGNGVNFDDGGTYESPAHHIHFVNCTFRDINATGNNDLLKMSGIDFFEIRNCTFLNGAEGGSGIDMVGCHDGLITHNHFENQGSNAIQAKGGTARIVIENNFFKHCGQRALNLGGSTGLQFFRPIDAPYEAAELYAYANVFVGAITPVGFVGAVNCEFVNNTIYRPEKWALRILQETVDTTRFLPCGYNTFSNNIVYLDNRVTTECNIGPNTAPETFTMSNNLWINIDDSGWDGPQLPVADPNMLVQVDPLFVDPDNDNFDIEVFSPAIGNGLNVPQPVNDYLDRPFNTPRSIGAFEGDPVTSVDDPVEAGGLQIFPQPVRDYFNLSIAETAAAMTSLQLFSMDGVFISTLHGSYFNSTSHAYSVSNIPSGKYLLKAIFDDGSSRAALLIKL